MGSYDPSEDVDDDWVLLAPDELQHTCFCGFCTSQLFITLLSILLLVSGHRLVCSWETWIVCRLIELVYMRTADLT